MKLAFAFLLTLIGDGTLALRRLTGIERLAWLSLRRNPVRWKGRQHAGATGSARPRARTRGQRPAALLKRTTRRSGIGTAGTRGERAVLTWLLLRANWL